MAVTAGEAEAAEAVRSVRRAVVVTMEKDVVAMKNKKSRRRYHYAIAAAVPGRAMVLPAQRRVPLVQRWGPPYSDGL